MSTFTPTNEHDTLCTCGAELYEHAGVACPPRRPAQALMPVVLVAGLVPAKSLRAEAASEGRYQLRPGRLAPGFFMVADLDRLTRHGARLKRRLAGLGCIRCDGSDPRHPRRCRCDCHDRMIFVMSPADLEASEAAARKAMADSFAEIGRREQDRVDACMLGMIAAGAKWEAPVEVALQALEREPPRSFHRYDYTAAELLAFGHRPALTGPVVMEVEAPAELKVVDSGLTHEQLAQAVVDLAAGELVAPGEFAMPESLAADVGEALEAARAPLGQWGADEDPLHPNGRCTCAGEGRCDWCQRIGNQVEEEG